MPTRLCWVSPSQALAYLGDWVQHIASGEAGAHEASAVRAAADALRLDGHLRPLQLPAEVKWDEFVPASLPSDLPTSADLDLPPVFEVIPAAEQGEPLQRCPKSVSS